MFRAQEEKMRRANTNSDAQFFSFSLSILHTLSIISCFFGWTFTLFPTHTRNFVKISTLKENTINECNLKNKPE
jgi:hypothetical protein